MSKPVMLKKRVERQITKNKMSYVEKEREIESAIKQETPVMFILNKEAYFSSTNLGNPFAKC